MAPQQPNRFFEIEQVGEVKVVRFSPDLILSGQKAEAVGEQLQALVNAPGQNRLLLDFANVRSVSSLVLGKLVELTKNADLAGGRVALCNLRPDIREILEITRLNRILRLYREEQEALQSF